MTTYLHTPACPRLSWRLQTLAAGIAAMCAVLLPQLCHAVGSMTGIGAVLGSVLLPMHLPVMLVGLLAGPYAGVLAGALAPCISFALSGMPSAALLPFMTLELITYGLVMGLLRATPLSTLGKVLVAQVAGRAVRAAALLTAVYACGYTGMAVSVIWTSIPAGLAGLCLQWLLLPLIARRVRDAS